LFHIKVSLAVCRYRNICNYLNWIDALLCETYYDPSLDGKFVFSALLGMNLGVLARFSGWSLHLRQNGHLTLISSPEKNSGILPRRAKDTGSHGGAGS
jgi:hypothetical protein